MIQELIQKLVDGLTLSFDESVQAMNQIMEGEATPAQFGAFVTALRLKGETVDEVAGMASVMREKSLQVNTSGNLVDTCGTGGDSSGTFNVSTASAFVAAGAGAKVAKHGNRAMSGKTGSADVLEALGANISLSPESVEKCIEQTGFGFMFAQGFHPSMRFAASPRREIGIRTVFNILGPLTNPAGALNQVVGVSDLSTGEIVVRSLARLGSKKALVVHGADGLDEITISGPSTIWFLANGFITKSEVSPDQFGIGVSPIADIKALNPSESAEIIKDVVDGGTGAAQDIVVLNTSATLVSCGIADDLEDGIELAKESIVSGRAASCLNAYVSLSKSLN